MKTRQEIKAHAKESVAMQRDKAILIPFLIILVAFAATYLGTLVSYRASYFGTLLYFAITCVITVLSVNIYKPFYNIYNREAAEISEPFRDLGLNFFRKLGGTFWMVLWITIWSLTAIIPGIIIISLRFASAFYYGNFDNRFSIALWVMLAILVMYIPGIVKSYSYLFATNILAIHPEVTATKALKLSMRITKGHRWELFVMHLSFIGWLLLSALTLGILYIIYVGPYIYATNAGFFTEMRDEAIAEGRIYAHELELPQGMQFPPTDF